MNKLLDSLNPDQKKAVTHKKGPLLILAGAGSGKTRALTYRAAYLISEHGIEPERILLTTFTNKAAGEMQERLEKLVGYRLPYAGTFHSLSARLLRKHAPSIGLDRDFVIYDTNDSLDAIKLAMQELGISIKDTRPRGIYAAIEEAKHELITPSDYAEFARGPYQQSVAKVYTRYQQLLKKFNALDFNDLLINMVKLLTEAKHIAQQYQDQFLHVLVDEYQDTNKAQYLITKLLSHKHKNVCVVGDASQAIYSWRGADYRNLSLLQSDFSDLTTIKLEQNYRSTQNILNAADEVISHNILHPVLTLWTQSKPGDPVKVYQAKDEYDEINRIVNEVKSHQQQNKSLSEIAILYRTNAQSRVIEESFIKKGIPYVLIGGTKFYDRKEVKDVLSYIRYAYNPADEVSYNRIIKLGKRRFQNFHIWLESKADLDDSPLNILDSVLETSDYLSRYKQKRPEDAARIENVRELRSVAQGFNTLAEFLENVALVEQESHSEGPKVIHPGLLDKPDAVVLMTIHASKGLEFDRVFMIGMEEGLFPHSRALLAKEDIEEERRLCYVGMTRARYQLHLSYASSRVYFGARTQNQVSRFIGELPSTGVDIKNHTPTPSTYKKSTPLDEKLLDQFLNDEVDIDALLNL